MHVHVGDRSCVLCVRGAPRGGSRSPGSCEGGGHAPPPAARVWLIDVEFPFFTPLKQQSEEKVVSGIVNFGFGPPRARRVRMPRSPSSARSAAETQLLLLLLLRIPHLTQSTTLFGADLLSTNSSTGTCVASCSGTAASTAAFDNSPSTIARLPGPAPWLQAAFESAYRLTGYQFSVYWMNPATQPPPTAWVVRCEKGEPGNTTLVEIDRRANETLTKVPYFHIYTFATGLTQGCVNARFEFLGYDDASSVPPPVNTLATAPLQSRISPAWSAYGSGLMLSRRRAACQKATPSV